MKTKTVYQTDHLGIYVAPTVADSSPLEPNVWMIPAGCVELPPPAAGTNQVQFWDGAKWQLIDSYKGLTAYSTATGAPIVIQRSGPLPNGFTLEAPGPHQVWRNGQWEDDVPAVLRRLHAEQTAMVNQACEQEILGGFWSDRLGQRHLYSSQIDDQLNLIGMILLGLDCPYACRDEVGKKEFRPHTADQLRAVGDDFSLFKLLRLQLANELKNQLDAAVIAGDVAAMAAIKWTSPQP